MPTNSALSLQPTYDAAPPEIFTPEAVNQTPMRRLAIESVKAERGAHLQSIRDEARNAPPVQTPVTRKLLSPSEFTRKFAPEMVGKRMWPRRVYEAMDKAYNEYVAQETHAQENEQQQSRYARTEVATERRHGEDIGLRREEMKQRGDIAGRKAELSPQDDAFRMVLQAKLKENPDDPYGALASAALAAKGGATAAGEDPLKKLTADAIAEQSKLNRTPTETRAMLMGQGKAPAVDKTSFLDKKKVQEDLTGEVGKPGLMGYDKPGILGEPPVGKLKGFEAIAGYVKSRAPLAAPQEKELLRGLLVANKPSPEDIQAAFDAHDPLFWGPEEGILSKLFVRGKPSQADREAAARAKAAEYTKMVMSVGE